MAYAAGFRFRSLAVYPVLCRCYRNCSKTRRAEQILIRPLTAHCRRSLTLDARQTVATAFIASRADYCSAVLFVWSHEHIPSPVLRYVVHWLPVPQQMQFKIAFLAFNCIQDDAGSAYFQHIHMPTANVWPSRSPFSGTWRLGHAENSKGTRQTKASFFNTYQNLTGRGC